MLLILQKKIPNLKLSRKKTQNREQLKTNFLIQQVKNADLYKSVL